VPLPRWLARANRAGLNRVAKRIAPWAPSLGLVVHRGRRSGRRYETPVMVFADGGGFIISLTYGGDRTEWVKNVLAAGGCELRTGGRVLTMESPRVYRDETRHGVGPFKRRVLALIGAADFLSLKTAS
jgi:deazaflavin-dependent oxidoreductase (nitroreductase family)